MVHMVSNHIPWFIFDISDMPVPYALISLRFMIAACVPAVLSKNPIQKIGESLVKVNSITKVRIHKTELQFECCGSLLGPLLHSLLVFISFFSIINVCFDYSCLFRTAKSKPLILQSNPVQS